MDDASPSSHSPLEFDPCSPVSIGNSSHESSPNQSTSSDDDNYSIISPPQRRSEALHPDLTDSFHQYENSQQYPQQQQEEQNVMVQSPQNDKVQDVEQKNYHTPPQEQLTDDFSSLFNSPQTTPINQPIKRIIPSAPRKGPRPASNIDMLQEFEDVYNRNLNTKG